MYALGMVQSMHIQEHANYGWLRKLLDRLGSGEVVKARTQRWGGCLASLVIDCMSLHLTFSLKLILMDPSLFLLCFIMVALAMKYGFKCTTLQLSRVQPEGQSTPHKEIDPSFSTLIFGINIFLTTNSRPRLLRTQLEGFQGCEGCCWCWICVSAWWVLDVLQDRDRGTGEKFGVGHGGSAESVGKGAGEGKEANTSTCTSVGKSVGTGLNGFYLTLPCPKVQDLINEYPPLWYQNTRGHDNMDDDMVAGKAWEGCLLRRELDILVVEGCWRFAFHLLPTPSSTSFLPASKVNCWQCFNYVQS